MGEDLHKLSVKCAIFKLREKSIRLISFHDIRNELANEELEAWQKMIKVLRHEIMNSVTPIKSLTSTLIRKISTSGRTKSKSELSDEAIQNIHTGLLAIEKRNQGMLNFVESYQNLTKIKTPVFVQVNVSDLFGNITTLLVGEVKKQHIQLVTKVRPMDILIKADERLITQTLMNLIKNSIEALTDSTDGTIYLDALQENDDPVIIKITDNGPGIPLDIIDQIFIPFFTTKENGSGIGLSLSRQIMWLHHGHISANSPEGERSYIQTCILNKPKKR